MSVHWARLDAQEPLAEPFLGPGLDPRQVLRLRRLRDPALRRASRLGLALIVRAARAAGVADFGLADLRFEARGKPRSRRGVAFSVAHSGGIVACALARGIERIGLDVEQVREIEVDAFRIYLTEGERRLALWENEQFFTTWTRKESVVKATGSGLADLARVELTGDGALLDHEGWRLTPLVLWSAYAAHVATPAEHAAPRVTAQRWEAAELALVSQPRIPDAPPR